MSETRQAIAAYLCQYKLNMERRVNPQTGRNVLPFGNSPEALSKSPEGRRVLKKEIVGNMMPIWTHVGKLPVSEAERLGNEILQTGLQRRQLLEIHANTSGLFKKLKNQLPF